MSAMSARGLFGIGLASLALEVWAWPLAACMVGLSVGCIAALNDDDVISPRFSPPPVTEALFGAKDFP